MGRSKKNKREDNNGSKASESSKKSNNNKSCHAGSNKKMRHNEREWILDCQDSKPPSEGETYDIELLVTRSVLQDDYGKIVPAKTTQDAPCKSVVSDNKSSGNGKNEKLKPGEKVAASNLKSEDTVPIILFQPFSDTNPEASKQSPHSPNSSNALNEESSSPTVGVKKSNNAKRPMPKVRAAVAT